MMKIKVLKVVFGLFLTLTISQLFAYNTVSNLHRIYEDNPSKIDRMKLKITIGKHILVATLDDNPTSRDFIRLLPLTVKLDDYANTEKIFYPSKKLTVQNAPDAIEPKSGDITYYAPWGNIAIFYKNFRHSPGLIKIGHIKSGMEKLQLPSSIEKVRFELIKD